MQNNNADSIDMPYSRNYQNDTFKVFTLDELEIPTKSFLETFSPTFHLASWDYYDVRREQISIIKENSLKLSHQDNKRLIDYYSADLSFDGIKDLFDNLSEKEKNRFHNCKPYRRRFVSEFEVNKEKNLSWHISKGRQQSFSQRVSDIDIRSVPRIFEPISSEITEIPEFRKLLYKITEMVAEVREAVKELSITCWHTSIMATQEKVGSNSPEGIHQDGADFIISALVVDRKNITGGTSRIFGPDKKTQLLTHTLQPGQGIFQADAGSNLWHDVTPIAIADPKSGNGERNLLGFDIQVKS